MAAPHLGGVDPHGHDAQQDQAQVGGGGRQGAKADDHELRAGAGGGARVWYGNNPQNAAAAEARKLRRPSSQQLRALGACKERSLHTSWPCNMCGTRAVRVRPRTCWMSAPPDLPRGLQITSMAALPLVCRGTGRNRAQCGIPRVHIQPRQPQVAMEERPPAGTSAWNKRGIGPATGCRAVRCFPALSEPLQATPTLVSESRGM